MFGLAAIAAVLAMAFVGASSAMATFATLLCEKDTASSTPTAAECESPKLVHFLSVKLNASEEWEDAKAKLLSSITTVECNALVLAHLVGNALQNAGTPVLYEGLLVYENCNCTVTVLEQGHIDVLKTAEELAEITGKNYVVKVNCFGLFNCDYNAAGLVGEGLGGLHKPDNKGLGIVHFNATLVNLKEDLNIVTPCPAEAFLDALFKSLTPLYIRS